MFKIISKKRYEKEINEKYEISLEYSRYKSKTDAYIDDLNKQTRDLCNVLDKRNKELDKSNKELIEKEKEITCLQTKIKKKEKLRRKSAGKTGGLVKQNQKLLAERQEMLELINNLIVERQKLKQERKRPTIGELKRYFRKY